MKIQEWRSGISRLSKRPEGERRERTSRALTTSGADTRPETACELDEPQWSVVSFDKCEAGGLTYRQAVELLAVLDDYGMNGLCVITDEAAQRYGS